MTGLINMLRQRCPKRAESPALKTDRHRKVPFDFSITWLGRHAVMATARKPPAFGQGERSLTLPRLKIMPKEDHTLLTRSAGTVIVPKFKPTM
jgi:hypothetical protein